MTAPLDAERLARSIAEDMTGACRHLGEARWCRMCLQSELPSLLRSALPATVGHPRNYVHIQFHRQVLEKREAELAEARRLLARFDAILPHVYWTSDDGDTTRPGEPEDADGPEMRKLWEDTRAFIAAPQVAPEAVHESARPTEPRAHRPHWVSDEYGVCHGEGCAPTVARETEEPRPCDCDSHMDPANGYHYGDCPAAPEKEDAE